jgi:ribosomal protein L7Ae-like RNA K-turn-binding protein
MEQDARLGFLGILYASHRALIGDELFRHLEKVHFIVMANNLSSGQSKMWQKKISSRHIPTDAISFNAKELGKALGHEEINFIGITDKKSAISYVTKSTKGVKHEEE